MKIFFKILAVSALAAAFCATAHAQRATSTAGKVYPLTPEDAAERWNEFLNSAAAPYYTFKLELEHRPRKGESVLYDAIMCGRHRGDSFAIRLHVAKRGDSGRISNFLLVSERGSAQIYEVKGGKIERLDESEWQRPLLEGLIYTPFDALMPYKHWDWSYGGPGRVGRALHFFDLNAPADFANSTPEFARVRVGLSREFNAPFHTEYYDSDNVLVRTLSLSSVKKFQENWIVKQIEMTDNTTKDKDRITFTAGSFAPLSDSVFEVKNLDKIVAIPELESL